jgi:glyoxylase-like metal-dependent hydrolase (beta-lactamase superfamily II)
MIPALSRPRLDAEETAVRRVQQLGFSPRDVRHILVTHLDPDHAGGLSDFPEAAVHATGREIDAALNPTAMERQRYRAAQLAHGPRWVRHAPAGERWMGFECVRDLPGLPPEILLVPLYGHSRGHSAVAVSTGRGWLLHAGDAYFYRGEVDPDAPSCPPALRVFQRFAAVDDAARLRNQARLRELARERRGGVTIFSSHDPVELARAQEAKAKPEGAE